MKALGYTTGQLMLQTALSFMPAVVISTTVGITVSSCVINRLVGLFLNGIGIVKSTLTVPIGFNVLAGMVLILFAFVTVCLLSLKIRRIVPKELIAGE